MNVRYRITLSSEERAQLRRLVQGGKGRFRRLKRAQILLAAASGSSDDAIAVNVSVGTSTVYRTKRRFVEEGWSSAQRSAAARCGAQARREGGGAAGRDSVLEASGRAGSLDLALLADEMVRLTKHRSLSSETIRRRLAENELKPWQKKMWCIPKVDAEFVARMEDVLDLYAEAPDERRPVVCFDETPRQLIGESRVPVAAKPGKPARVDYEYVRNGTANVFMFVDAHRPWRHAKVTDRRTSRDFAECMRDLVDKHYPKAERIRVVMDNLSTHTPAALYETFDPAEARRILRRLEFHYTPKHASWLNMVEIEIGVMVSQCLDRRIPSKSILVWEVGLGATTEQREGPHQVALHGRARPRETRQVLSHAGRSTCERAAA